MIAIDIYQVYDKNNKHVRTHSPQIPDVEIWFNQGVKDIDSILKKVSEKLGQPFKVMLYFPGFRI